MDRRTRRRRTGRPLYDPAWDGRTISCRRPAAGNGPTRVHRQYRRRQRRNEPRAGSAGLRGGTTKPPLRIHPYACQRRSHHRRHRPQIEIPIAVDCAPRVPSSGTFVRLPAPETLHDTGLSASGSSASVASIGECAHYRISQFHRSLKPTCARDGNLRLTLSSSRRWNHRTARQPARKSASSHLAGRRMCPRCGGGSYH